MEDKLMEGLDLPSTWSSIPTEISSKQNFFPLSPTEFPPSIEENNKKSSIILVFITISAIKWRKGVLCLNHKCSSQFWYELYKRTTKEIYVCICCKNPSSILFFQNKAWIFAIIVNMLRGDFVTFTIYQTRGGGGGGHWPPKSTGRLCWSRTNEAISIKFSQKRGSILFPPPPGY